MKFQKQKSIDKVSNSTFTMSAADSSWYNPTNYLIDKNEGNAPMHGWQVLRVYVITQ